MRTITKTLAVQGVHPVGDPQNMQVSVAEERAEGETGPLMSGTLYLPTELAREALARRVRITVEVLV